MALTINLPPEKEESLKAQAQARGLTVGQWFLQLAGQSVPLPSSAAERDHDDDRPIWEVILDSMKDVPSEDLAALPEDGSSQIDHYLYGHPKR
jgi:hypothetical protein